jgi:hypothetical protein
MPEGPIMAASRVVPPMGCAGLRTMGEEDLFAYLCLHGALHPAKQHGLSGGASGAPCL